MNSLAFAAFIASMVCAAEPVVFAEEHQQPDEGERAEDEAPLEQDTPSTQRRTEPNTEARALYEAGEAAFHDNRPADAQELFRRSLQLEAHRWTAWNLALALRATNDLVAAVRLLDRLVAGEFGELPDSERPEMMSLRQELLGRLSTLNIRTNHTAPVEATVDGQIAGVVDPGGRLEHLVSPGPHLVIGTAADADAVERRVDVAIGDVSEVILSFSRRRPVWRRAWFWIVTVAIPVAVVSGVAIWLALRDDEGTEWPPLQALLGVLSI